MKKLLKKYCTSVILTLLLCNPNFLFAESIEEKIKEALQPKNAIDQIRMLEKITTEHPEASHTDLALTYYYLNVRYRKLKKLRSAIISGKKAEMHYEQIQSTAPRRDNNHLLIAKSFYNIGQIDSTLYYLEKVDFAHFPEKQHWIYNEVAVFHSNVLYQLEEYELAYKVLLPIWKQGYYQYLEPDEKHKYLWHALRALSYYNSYRSLLTIDTILTAASQISPLPEQKVSEEITFEIEYGNHLLRKEKFNNAVDQFLTIIDKYTQLQPSIWNPHLVKCYINLAYAYEKTGKYDQMLEVSKKSLPLPVESTQNAYAKWLNYANACKYHFQLPTVLESIDSAFFALGEGRFKPSENIENQMPLLDLYIDLTKIHWHFGEDEKAKESLENAIHIASNHVDNVLYEHSILRIKKALSEKSSVILDQLFEKREYNLFWQFSELLKSTIPLNYIHSDTQNDQFSWSEKLEELEKKSESEEIKILLGINNSDSTVLSINRQKLRLLRQFKSDKATTNKGQQSITTFQQSIADDTQIIDFHYTQNNVYAIHITAEGLRISDIGKLALVQSQIDSLYSFYSLNGIPHKSMANILNSLLDTNYQKVVLIPDGNMFKVPFDHLINTHTRKAYQVSQAISCRIWQLLLKKNRITEKITIHQPEYGDNTEILDFKFSSISVGYQDLSNYLSNKLHLSYKTDHITKKSVFTALSQSDIYHFSGHAQTMPGISKFSFLALPPSEKDDYIATAAEISRTHIPSSLIILSACETGLGDFHAGEGVMNLSRAFLQAGAASVVQTLWKVNEQSTSQIITSFYKYLLDGQHKSEALWNAKQDFLATCPDYQKHPYYWAGIVVVGNDEPLQFIQSNPLRSLILGVSILIILLSIAFTYRNKFAA